LYNDFPDAVKRVDYYSSCREKEEEKKTFDFLFFPGAISMFRAIGQIVCKVNIAEGLQLTWRRSPAYASL
jgi:hypothetical protein